ncbi:CheR family methyltransferase [Brumicola pallidula]|uniref:protein-glutamate O-methyltransferase n=1 Tax=Brumicola pallidula DSM 14239 = ACAM 615 TaxID=1121922 RepID=K6ZV26_9ALTE|nr:protein-glutamate O-methyltransferase CheR [Glaciecola pallidula]GAC27190.1 chemotaxis protein methyltransferase 1 [Glaciecola pallidula DSM 14239 = ACAM 615]
MNKQLSPVSYERFGHFLHSKSGIVLGAAKQYLVRSRMVPLMHRFASADIDSLIQKVISQQDPVLTQAALEAMTTNETLWFRDKYPFEILFSKLLPELAKKQDRIRIWSAASSTGQEAYSIAMTIADFLRVNRGAFNRGIDIIGTDLSSKVIKTASAGTYDTLSLNRGLTDDVKRRYFTLNPDQSMTINADIRQWVSFRQFNLTSNFSTLGKFDIVFCRNVLIYFDAERKTVILQDISACLQSEGTLLLGASESLGNASNKFKMITQPTGLYYLKV